MLQQLLQSQQIDVADVHDILEKLPAWNLMSIPVRQEYHLDLLGILGNREINPFSEMMLTTAVRRWRSEIMATLTITSYVVPEDIERVFGTFKHWTDQVKRLEATEGRVALIRKGEEADMASNPDFKWGKNETEREAQFRIAYPETAKLSNETEVALKDAKDMLARVEVDLKRIRYFIDFFKTTTIEV
jgi:hypothetical protein